MDVKIKINGSILEIGSPAGDIVRAGFSHCGLFVRRPAKRYAKTYGIESDNALWIKNPEIICFDCYPITGNDPNARSSDAIYGTSAFAFFSTNNVSHLFFQIFGSVTYARGFANDFRVCAFTKLGSARFSKQIRIPRYLRDKDGGREAIFTAWSGAGRYIVCELRPMGDGCYIHIGHGDIPENIDCMLVNEANEIDDVSDNSFFDSLLYPFHKDIFGPG